jgi:glucosamine-phosphate N-acetyltransferase
MNGYTIRRLQPEDFEHGFWDTLHHLTSVGSTDLSKALEVYNQMKQVGMYNTFVAVTDEGEVVGLITLLVDQKFARSFAKAGHIEDVVVRKEYEGRGIGSALLAAAEEEAKRQGCYKTNPTTRSQKTAEWYKNHGYHEWGI